MMCVNVTTNVKYRFKVFWQVSLHWKVDHIGIKICAFMEYLQISSKAIPARGPEWQKAWGWRNWILQACSERKSFILSFPTPDQVEDDVKDMVYQLRESLILSFPIHRESPLGTQMRFRFFDRNDRRLEDDETEYHRPFRERKSFILSFPTPDQAEDIKDKVYQTAEIAHTVIPDTSGIAFFIRMRFPIRLGMTERPEWRADTKRRIPEPMIFHI